MTVYNKQTDFNQPRMLCVIYAPGFCKATCYMVDSETRETEFVKSN